MNLTLPPLRFQQDLSTIFPRQRLLNQIPSWVGEWSTKKSGIRRFHVFFFLENNSIRSQYRHLVTYVTSYYIRKEFPLEFVNYALKR